MHEADIARESRSVWVESRVSPRASRARPHERLRFTANAPHGEYIDPKQAEAASAAPKPTVDPRENGWLASSLELLGGVRIALVDGGQDARNVGHAKSILPACGFRNTRSVQDMGACGV